MKLYELLRDGVPVAEVVEFTNGDVTVAEHGHFGAALYANIGSIPVGPNEVLVRRHAPHAFRADRQAYGEVGA